MNTAAAVSPVSAFPLVLFFLVLFCFKPHTRGVTYPEASAMPLDTRPGFSQVHCNRHLTQRILSKYTFVYSLLSFRCHHPHVIGTVIMTQVKGRAEIQRIMKGVK